MRFWSKALQSEVKSLQILAVEHKTLGTNSLDLGASHPAVKYLGPEDDTSLWRHFQSLWKPGAAKVLVFSAGAVLRVLSPSGQPSLVPNTFQLK